MTGVLYVAPMKNHSGHHSPIQVLVLVALVFLPFISCSINPYDRAQQPVIGINQEDGLRINWAPQGAWHVRVLKGVVNPEDPENTRPPSRGVMWSIAKAESSVRSPLSYGQKQEGTSSSDAAPLVPGETYTVYVLREDPKGSGGGFTNTHNVYEATAVFVAR